MSDTTRANSSDGSGSRSGTAVGVRPASLGILAAISLSHLLNDSIQAVLPAIYPLLKETFRVCAYLPLIGLLAVFLPSDRPARG